MTEKLQLNIPNGPFQNPAQVNLILRRLALGYTILGSCKAAGIPHTTFDRWRQTNPRFKIMVERALEIGNARLEDEAVRRAAEGVLEPKFHGGEIVGHVPRYSDGLLKFILQARKPEVYRSQQENSASGPVLELTQILQEVGSGERTLPNGTKLGSGGTERTIEGSAVEVEQPVLDNERGRETNKVPDE